MFIAEVRMSDETNACVVVVAVVVEVMVVVCLVLIGWECIVQH